MTGPAPAWGECHECHRLMAMREDGTVRIHRPKKRAGRQNRCIGSLEKPYTQQASRPTVRKRFPRDVSRMIGGGCG